jgi:phosphate transport system permease protein
MVFIALIWLLYTLVKNGAHGIRWSTFSQVTESADVRGGLLNAIVGSLLLVSLGLIIGSFIGIFVGIFLAEFYQSKTQGTIVRFLLDILLGIPAIIIGLFIYQIYIIQIGHFSGWGGSFALAIMVIPVVARTTENAYVLVPRILKESVLALGAPRWKLIQLVLINVIRTSVLTGILLSMARISGEAAPLLFTALNNSFWSLDMNQPMANLPSTIFYYAMSPYDTWQQLAWTGALIITAWVLFINLLSRSLVKTHQIPY